MEMKPPPICREHQKPKEWRQTAFEYSEDGISVRVSAIYAWVCPEDGDASFTPQTADELLATVRELIESAKQATARRSRLSEHLVSISFGEQLKSAA
jgi:hypothetical protein